MTKEEKNIIKKWEELGFLDDLSKPQKLPISKALDLLTAFITDLDENKRFNHADLQELLDIGIAMFIDILPDNLDHQINTDNLFRLFFNTQIKELGDNLFNNEMNDLLVYQLIRYNIIPDEGKAMNEKYGEDVEAKLRDLLIDYYKNNYLNINVINE